MSERCSHGLRATARPIWEAIFRHPFLSQLEATGKRLAPVEEVARGRRP